MIDIHIRHLVLDKSRVEKVLKKSLKMKKGKKVI